MMNNTHLTTEAIAAAIRKDPVVELMVPSYAFRTVPLPAVLRGVSCLVFFFYPAKGGPGKSKITYPPLTSVIVAKDSGKVIQIVSAPLFWPKGISPDRPIGQYPGKALSGLSLQEMDALYARYYETCDQLFQEAGNGELMHCPAFKCWEAAFASVREDGFDAFFTAVLPHIPASASNAELKPSSGSNQPSSKNAPTSHMSPDPASGQTKTDMMHHMQVARQFLMSAGLQDLASIWRDIASKREQAWFSVAAVGEFSRGKSTLLNQLIGEDILPVGDLPTTAMLTRIKHGIRRVGCRILPDTTQQDIEVSSEFLGKFRAEVTGCDSEGVIQIEVPNPWMDAGKLVLYDTPGTGDLTGRRAALAVEAIARCDGTIVVINATMPCSMTEMEFVHDHLISKRIPHIAVAVAKLDLIPPSERQAVVAHIASKLHELSPSIKIWTSQTREQIPEVDDPGITAAGASAIRDRISAWASDPDIVALRNYQAAAQLRGLLTSAVNMIAQQVVASRLSKQERLNAIKWQKDAIERSSMDWEDLKIAMDRRASEAERWLHTIMVEKMPDVAEDIKQSLSRTSNPKSWWEKDFPYQLRRIVKSMSASIMQQVDLRIAADHDWIDNEVRSRFHLPGIAAKMERATGGFTPPDQLPGKKFPDLDRRKTISRLALLGGTVLSYGLLSPLGLMPVAIGVTGALTVWSETTLKKLIENQKLTLTVDVDTSVDQVFRELEQGLMNRIASWYDGIFKAIKQETSNWQHAQLSLIEKGAVASVPEINHIEMIAEQGREQLTILDKILEEAK